MNTYHVLIASMWYGRLIKDSFNPQDILEWIYIFLDVKYKRRQDITDAMQKKPYETEEGKLHWNGK